MKKIFGLILIFGVVCIMAIFGFLFTKSLIGDNIIIPINTALQTGASGLVSSQITDAMDDTVGVYTGLDLKADLIFLITWIVFEVSIIFMAIYSPKLPTISFLSFLMFGMLIVGFIFDFISQFSTWFITEFINGIFDSSDSYMPIFNFYVNTQVIIIFINIVGVLLINQLFSRKENSAQINTEPTIPVINENATGGEEE